MDEIAARLKNTTDSCLEAYNVWHKDKKATEPTADLKEAVHELRKVASRLEIEIAKNEREELAQRPIPIPPHRSKRKIHKSSEANGNSAGPAENGNVADDGDEDVAAPVSVAANGPKIEMAKRRIVRRKKPESGE